MKTIQEVQDLKRGCCRCPKLTFIFLVALDLLIVFLVWQAMVFLNYGLVNLIDLPRRRNDIFINWPYFVVDYLHANLFFFYFIGSTALCYLAGKFIYGWMFRKWDPDFSGLSSRGYGHYGYQRNDMLDWFFLWYFWSVWYPTPGYYVPHHHYGSHGGWILCGSCNSCETGGGSASCDTCTPISCSGGDLNCGDCNGCGDSGGGGGGIIAVILIVVVVVLLVILAILVCIGIVVGMYLLAMIMYKIVRKRMMVLQKKQLIEYTIIADLDRESAF
jgi:hypothetical protein